MITLQRIFRPMPTDEEILQAIRDRAAKTPQFQGRRDVDIDLIRRVADNEEIEKSVAAIREQVAQMYRQRGEQK
jgi:hypothetical protein